MTQITAEKEISENQRNQRERIRKASHELREQD